MTLLADVLDASAAAPVRLVIVRHSLATPAQPLVDELRRRALDRNVPVLSINAFPGASSSSSSSRAHTVLDLSVPPGYGPDDGTAAAGPSSAGAALVERVNKACAALAPGTNVFIDAPDVLADDYGSQVVLRGVRAVLAAVGSLNPPGRLITSLPPSPLLDDLTSATLSPSLALLTAHHPLAAEAAARAAAVLPATDDPRFFSTLERAAAERSADMLALRGPAIETGIELGPRDAYAVQVLLRKATGGAKGMLRAVEAVKFAGEAWGVAELTDVVSPAAVAGPAAGQAVVPGKTHADLNLPFNLSLTDRQRAERGAVPLPYAHEGEGADLGMGMDWSDDEEDDEV